MLSDPLDILCRQFESVDSITDKKLNVNQEIRPWPCLSASGSSQV